MYRNVVADERDFGRFEGVLVAELELELELFALIQGACGAVHVYHPSKNNQFNVNNKITNIKMLLYLLFKESVLYNKLKKDY